MKLQTKRIGLGVIIFIAIILLFTGYHVQNTYRNEKNAGIILKGIIQLELERKDVVQLNESKNLLYLTKSNPKHILEFMKNKGWENVDRMGGRVFFRNSNGDTMSLMTRLVYSSSYSLWEIDDPKNKFTP